ncbi:MAG: autotransporter outer membrane beta-barrel domain-containing protein [Rhodospirillales bacterium]|nr:autotransporter outer membrane beta-barrel domain-containing protein [Rhodospirillales bacterium]
MKNLSSVVIALLSSTFLSAPAWAVDMNANYLNSLTGPKVNWSESEGTEVTIGGKTFYYNYTKPEDYEETSTRINDTLATADVDKKLFTGISGPADGGAIYSKSSAVGNIDIYSDFLNNTSSSTSTATTYGAGMALRGTPITLGTISGDFVGNRATSDTGNVVGSAIYFDSLTSAAATIDTIEGNFINNSAYTRGGSSSKFIHGGAIDNHATINNINANFIGNYAKIDTGFVWGGALNNSSQAAAANAFSGVIGTLSGTFIGNTAESGNGEVRGGALYNGNSIGSILNSNFIDNTVIGNSSSNGGAIYSTGDLNLVSDNYDSLFEGNTVNGESNAIYITGADLNLMASNNGTITFNDNITGNNYNMNVTGNDNGEVVFNQRVDNAKNFTITDGAVARLGVNADINAVSLSRNTAATESSKSAFKVDLEVDAANQTTKSGRINLSGDVSGDYDVIVNSLNPDVYDGAYTAFLFAPDDTDSSDESFEVSRVIGSPYMWKAFLNYLDEEEGSTWYLALTDEENPDFPKPEPEPEPQPKPSKIYAPEVIAGIGLHEAAIEQTRSVVHNVKGKVAAGRELNPCCGIYDYSWDGKELRNIWVLAQGGSANIEEPVDMEAKIWGLEAGLDIQNDPHNTLGVFASYRNGEYELSGKGKKFRSNLGSEIDIDSYLAGLYYRYDRYLVWAFATIYGGIQQADVKTDDGIAKFDTDGIEFGASIEVGRTIELAHDLTLDPSVGLYYTQVNFDDADDNVGKHYEWDDIKHLEAELGAKLEKQFDNAKVYVRPSVIRTLTKDDSVLITGLNKADTYSDQTLGRIEIGGRYGFTDALSGYAWANYTFGSSYDAYALGAGLNYAW